MKRTIALLLITVLLLCGCQPAQESQDIVYSGDFETYFVSGTNSGADIRAEENPWWTSSYKLDEAVPQEKTVEVLGVSHTGTYQHSEIEKYNSYTTDYYRTAEKITFGVNRENGAVVFFDRRFSNYEEEHLNLPQLDHAREYAVEKATEIAAAFIDTARYEKEIDERESSGTLQGVDCVWTNYAVSFFKSVNGIKTTDYITVSITSMGTLNFIKMGDIGAFADFEDEAYTVDAIESSIGATLHRVCSEKNREEQSYKATEHVFAITPDGEYVVCSTLSVSWRDVETKNRYKSSGMVITKHSDAVTR